MRLTLTEVVILMRRPRTNTRDVAITTIMMKNRMKSDQGRRLDDVIN